MDADKKIAKKLQKNCKKMQKIAKKIAKNCKKLQKNCRKNGILEGRRSAVGDVLSRDVLSHFVARHFVARRFVARRLAAVPFFCSNYSYFFCKNLIITLVFVKNANFFAKKWEKLTKIVIITSTPDEFVKKVVQNVAKTIYLSKVIHA
jgi:hypothetical protein